MLSRLRGISSALMVSALPFAAGCGAGDVPAAPGVDLGARVLRIGALNDESGPAAAIGRNYAEGVRIAIQHSNEGGLGILPEGWRVELLDRDHGYNAQRSVQAYNELMDQVLYFAVSFGTPNTTPLHPMLERDGIVAFPASLSSVMANHVYTPPIGPAYKIEAMRALDFAIEHAGNKEAIRAGIIYQQDDYGEDGLAGWREAAAYHGVSIVSEQAIAAGQADMTAVITRLRDAGANYVMLTTLPSSTGPILGTAAQLGYTPVWLGQTPSWIDAFFDPQVIPPAVFANYYWVTGVPYWGEDLPGMREFLDAAAKYGEPNARPDFYRLMSYIQTLIGLEAFSRAIEAGNPTREGFLEGLRSMRNWNAGGLIQPIDFSSFPYVTATRTRVLRPIMGEARWQVVSDYAEPQSLAAAP